MVDRQVLNQLAPGFDPACKTLKVFVDGAKLANFVEFFSLYYTHDYAQEQPPRLEKVVVSDPMWEFVEKLPHNTLCT